MNKCKICDEEIKELFLGKLKGTIIKKPGSSKQYMICSSCQKKLGKKEEMLDKI
jgi:hypothetical protein